MAGARSEGTDMKEEAAKFWKFLDQLHDTKPEAYDQFVSQTLEDGREMFTPPTPKFCLKLTIAPKYNCTVLYVNICEWARIPGPKSNHDPVPVKGGVLRHKMDKVTNKKTNELIYDLAFNPSVLTEVSSSKELEETLTNLSFNYLMDIVEINVLNRRDYKKLKKQFVGRREDIQYSIDENWKQYLPQESRADFGDSILKEIGKLKLGKEDKGAKSDTDLPPLKVQPDSTSSPAAGPTGQTKQPKLIEEISSTAVPATSSCSQALCAPDYSLTVKELDAGQGKAVCVRVTLPGVKSVKEIALDVAKDNLSLLVEGRYELSVKLSVPVNEDSTKAAFKTKTSTLTVTMPCL